jgi:hypothetical protein
MLKMQGASCGMAAANQKAAGVEDTCGFFVAQRLRLADLKKVYSNEQFSL